MFKVHVAALGRQGDVGLTVLCTVEGNPNHHVVRTAEAYFDHPPHPNFLQSYIIHIQKLCYSTSPRYRWHRRSSQGHRRDQDDSA